ncbi:MAG: GNAT family N-acetyltransferase, partial [Pseudomonadota bacterium]
DETGEGRDDAPVPLETHYTITYLEMSEPPSTGLPHAPSGPRLALIGAKAPPVDWFLYLYRTVGAPYRWTDWLEAPAEDLEAFVGDPKVEIFTLLHDGWPGGFFMLDTREAGVCDLAYFGLVPQAVGRGLGFWLLMNAVHMGWERPGVERMSVNTCTLDHPRALGLYQRVGFVPVRRETRPLHP